MGILRELCHSHREERTRRVLPVVLPGHSPDEAAIPATVDQGHYVIPLLSRDGIGEVLGVLRGPDRATDAARFKSNS
jgi:hypothetical protein